MSDYLTEACKTAEIKAKTGWNIVIRGKSYQADACVITRNTVG